MPLGRPPTWLKPVDWGVPACLDCVLLLPLEPPAMPLKLIANIPQLACGSSDVTCHVDSGHDLVRKLRLVCPLTGTS